MSDDPIYLDFNATTPVLPAVVEAMLPYFDQHFGNPSSSHVWGRRARHAVDAARQKIAAAIGAADDEIVFTSGGTEASNLAIRGVVAARRERRHVVTSVVEHPATGEPCAELERQGLRVTRVTVDARGVVSLDGLAAAIDEDTALVTLIHANNETGMLQPIAEASRLTRARGALLHADAAQSLGKVPVDVGALGVDLLSIAGHKLYAPKGVGALYVRRGTPLDPFVRGAGHERGVRPGTENVASIVGLGVACELSVRELTQVAAHVRARRDALWEALRARVPGLALNGAPEPRLPNTLSVRFPRVSGAALLAAAPEVAAATGSACHAGVEHASPVILAMGVSESEAVGTVRLSVGRSTTEQDVVLAAEVLGRAFSRLVTHR